MRPPQSIVLRPLLTEKSVAGTEKGKYTFQVDMEANKIEVRQAIEAMYPEVKVAAVNTMIVHGKVRRVSGYGRRMGRRFGKTAVWKKAVVTLKSGKIPIFEGL
ncbi:MAG: 50S ribosomal protein L23 [Armatimonadetes bacterium]|nr:50S ribosomal protein L23 [Armatimonadota bacterium]NIM24255.1 50S ribosomal protein L23 [Armatimonadota bacterium]NIM68124.1 50S ribosomal protein L23 [Armatimonadota bacterium]NIM76586.1 50S ribosomal protein L23 [Armatimonadota bacterium]NIN06329.1 50S ribosomal protein L23 [Armatimonadota bacterium]